MATPTAVWSGSGTAKNKPGGLVFAVDISAVKVPGVVYICMGVCGNVAELNTTLAGEGGAVEATYAYTMPSKTAGPYFTATLTIPPARAAGGRRALGGTWAQTAADAVGAARNIQFHAIAVDAGGVIAGGVEVACSHGASGPKSGAVVLQAATLV
jgi:hypothetical protein